MSKYRAASTLRLALETLELLDRLMSRSHPELFYPNQPKAPCAFLKMRGAGTVLEKKREWVKFKQFLAASHRLIPKNSLGGDNRKQYLKCEQKRCQQTHGSEQSSVDFPSSLDLATWVV